MRSKFLLLFVVVVAMSGCGRRQAAPVKSIPKGATPTYPDLTLVISNERGTSYIPLQSMPTGEITHTHQAMEGTETVLDKVTWKFVKSTIEGDLYSMEVLSPKVMDGNEPYSADVLYTGSTEQVYSDELVQVTLKEEEGVESQP